MGTSENPLQQVLLAGVGVLAIGAEKSQQLVDELVRRGQITVGQGRDLVSDLSSRGEEDAARFRDELVRSYMKGMTKQQRDEFAAKVVDMAAGMDADGPSCASEDAGVQVTAESS